MTTRSVSFSVRLERLTRHVHLPDGRTSVHVCTLGVFERVVVYLDDHPDQGVNTPDLRRALADAPFAQIHVALDFLIACGLIVRRGRELYPCVPSLYEAALICFSELAETGG